LSDRGKSSRSLPKRVDATEEDNDECSERRSEARGGKGKESSAPCSEAEIGKSREALLKRKVGASGRSNGDELETGGGEKGDETDMLEDRGKRRRGNVSNDEGGGREQAQSYPISPKLRERES